MRSRSPSPISKDVVQGTVGGRAGGRFVMNDGETALVYSVHSGELLQENGFPLLQENGAPIWT